MGIAITLAQYLLDRGVPYDLVPHPHTETARASAAASGLSADRVVKAVVVKGAGRFLLALLPACVTRRVPDPGPPMIILPPRPAPDTAPVRAQAPELPGVPTPDAPSDGLHDVRVALLRRGVRGAAARQQRVEREALRDAEAGGILEFKCQRCRAACCIDSPACISRNTIERSVHPRCLGRVVDPQRERRCLVCRNAGGHEVNGFPGLVPVILQPPVEHSPTTVAEHNLRCCGFNSDLTLSGFARHRIDVLFYLG